MPHEKMTTRTLKIGVINLFSCKRSEMQYCLCLTKTVGFVLDETLFKSKTGSLRQLCPLCLVTTFILRERGRSCNYKTYFSTRELFCVFILIALNTLGVHLWIVKMKFFSTYRPLNYSTFQYCAVMR